MNPIIHSRSIKVTFIPVKDDYIHISRVISTSITDSRSVNYLYRAFLVLNAIGFPAYLIFAGYPMLGLAIFTANVLAFIILIPSNEKKKEQQFYDKLFKHIGDHPLEIELTANGIMARSDDDEGLIAWKNIVSIQESREVIYFFSRSKGMAVRKSGFGSDEQQAAFLETARYFHRLSKSDRLEKQPVSAISS